jgi:hypothetical protein
MENTRESLHVHGAEFSNGFLLRAFLSVLCVKVLKYLSRYNVSGRISLKIVFAFSSPYGIFSFRNEFALDGAVYSRLRANSAVTERDNSALR